MSYQATIIDHGEPVFCGRYNEEVIAYCMLEELLKFMSSMFDGENIWRRLSKYARNFESVEIDGCGFSVEAVG